MLVYREAERRSPATTALAAAIVAAEAVRSHATEDAAVELLIELGEFEAAVEDAMFPEADGVDSLERQLRTASIATARGVLTEERGRRASQAEHVLALLSSLPPTSLPREIALRVSEGYAYYSLDPRTYGKSAARFSRDCSPRHAICIGIRSIGTSLSAIVAAELEQRGVEVESYSVRPHGHPFDRELRIREDLASRFRAAPGGTFFLVIDEGPGLSGSSFGSVARALHALGIPEPLIVLFPSWEADASTFKSESARQAWQVHRRYAAARSPSTRGVNWSAGAWRPYVFGGDESAWPAVQPQHEVEKRWLPDEKLVVRFAGLGRYGRSKVTRAEALAAHGLGAQPVGLDHGFLSLEFIPGSTCPGVSDELCRAIANHIAFLARTFPCDRSPALDQLELMIATNAGSMMTPHLSNLLRTARPALEAASAARIDGRMLPHEWITSRGSAFIKVDALDHHADHFFPGTQDAGWDLAAATFEFGMDAAQRARLIHSYVSVSGDRDVTARLPFYDIAYPAFRLGYASLALESVPDARERERFRSVAARCRDRLMSPSAL